MTEGVVSLLMALVSLFYQAAGLLSRGLVVFLRLFTGQITGYPQGQDCCIQPPAGMRPRPDPYIYSQQWLQLRGIAYSWDNPDFTLRDSTGKIADRMDLRPGETYRIVVQVHNGSLFAAIGTSVLLEVLEFGAGGVMIDTLGSVAVDVEPFGVADAHFTWTTPASGGHSCLRATLSHPDDGNLLNNVGQHNTVVAKPTSALPVSTFIIRNTASGPRALRLEMDSYRLPNEPLRARTLEERNSLAYLRELRARNDRARFPVPASLGVRIAVGASAPTVVQGEGPSIRLDAGESIPITFGANLPGSGDQPSVVNIHAFDGSTLVGGVTIYVES
jgi:hypothetical protein